MDLVERVPVATRPPLDAIDAIVVASWCDALRALGEPVLEDEAIEQVAALERLKSAAAAAQARVTATLWQTRVARETDAGVPADQRGRGLADEIALARREHPSRGSRHLGLARALVEELPRTLNHLATGTTSEWAATVMARETAVLEPDDRRQVDAELAGRLPEMTPRQVERAARARAQALDAAAVVRRRARAVAERRVSLRPQPDAMASLTGLVPMEQGVAAWAVLRRDAEARKAAGDDRGIGQLMADLLVERVTGQGTADAVPVEVQLVMTPGTLLGLSDAPADLPGHGLLPAEVARVLVLGDDVPPGTHAGIRAGRAGTHAGGDAGTRAGRDAGTRAGRAGTRAGRDAGTDAGPRADIDAEPDADADTDAADPGEVWGGRPAARVWLRRVFTDEMGRVCDVDSRRRLFPAAVQRLLRVRDGVCRFPFCDAPVRHADHVVGVVLGGPTSAANGQGLCARHNLVKALPGWAAVVSTSGTEAVVVTTTPTGHRYRSPVPPVTELAQWRGDRQDDDLRLGEARWRDEDRAGEGDEPGLWRRADQQVSRRGEPQVRPGEEPHVRQDEWDDEWTDTWWQDTG
ncbi:HNH endonuclease signature motif containing protein [Janibacter melonis]|uniref:HNH endonuclease signature motif containing protein n=1 Tax=Janibacter melonis TaxID=262209 RepID=UPI00174DF416|nr:HNH endonuclease signature motif containing protein [Janibacter melonis]